MALPTSFMALITSPRGIMEGIPASAICADENAIIAPETFRLMHGISTKPATGSQTRPNMDFKVMAAASAHIPGVPPHSSVTAADPHSAWHPPSAPERVAPLAIIIPMPPAQNKPITA